LMIREKSIFFSLATTRSPEIVNSITWSGAQWPLREGARCERAAELIKTSCESRSRFKSDGYSEHGEDATDA
jgi:hypothetical protein